MGDGCSAADAHDACAIGVLYNRYTICQNSVSIGLG